MLGSAVREHDRDYERFEAVLNGTQADGDGPLRTVLTTGEEAAALSHGPSSAVIREAQAITDVRDSEPLRQKRLDTLTLQLAGSIPEQITHLRVGQHDGSGLVDDHRGILSGLEDRLQMG